MSLVNVTSWDASWAGADAGSDSAIRTPHAKDRNVFVIMQYLAEADVGVADYCATPGTDPQSLALAAIAETAYLVPLTILTRLTV